MYLPVQSQPVQRSIVGCPSASQCRMPGGAGPGIEPSGWTDWLEDAVSTVGDVLSNPTVQDLAGKAAVALGI